MRVHLSPLSPREPPAGIPRVTKTDLDLPEELHRRRPVRSLLILGGVIVGVIVAVTVLPGLASLRTRFAHASAPWLVLAAVLEALSSLSYVAVFRSVFCRRMTLRLSYQIGMSELAATALLPAGGAGGLALGAWALRRGGMPGAQIARRTVAFFLLTSLANFSAVVVVGLGLAAGLFPGHANLALTLGPAVAAGLTILAVLLAERLIVGARRKATGHGARLPSWFARAAGALADGISESVLLLRRGDVALLAGSFGYMAFDILVLWACFRAFGPTPPMAIIWIAYLIGALGGLLPLPGGIGGIDIGTIGTLVLYGVPVAAATAAVLGYRAIALWVPASLGTVAFLQLRRTLRREAHEIALCVPGTEIDVAGRGTVVIDAQPASGGA
jgi:uncharacterized protein (TIRG00374 family)